VPDGSYIIKEYCEISPRMEIFISTVSSLLYLEPEVTEILLQRYNWNKEKLQDEYLSDPDKVIRDAGLKSYDPPVIQRRILSFRTTEAVDSIDSPTARECSICFCKFEDFDGFSLGCEHWFCLSCYQQFLASEISSGPACVQVLFLPPKYNLSIHLFLFQIK
jgi:ariadne-1